MDHTKKHLIILKRFIEMEVSLYNPNNTTIKWHWQPIMRWIILS